MSYEGQYAPKLVTATVGIPQNPLLGNIVIPGLPNGLTFPVIVTGRAADAFFTKTATTDSVSLVSGAEGNNQLVHNHDASGNFTITLQHGSFYNRLLSIVFSAQKLIGSGQLPPFTFPVVYRDSNSVPAETHEASHCLIMRNPDVSFGASLGTIAWAFVATEIVSNFGNRIADV